MRTCPSCGRHLLADETVCPFCGATRRTILAPWPALAIAVVALVGCTDRTMGEDGSGAGSSGGTPTTPGDGNDGGDPDGGGSSSGAPDDGGTTTGGPGDGDTNTGTDDGWTGDDGGNTGDGGAFIYGEPDGGIVGQCDPGLQDCPNPDEKCTAYVTDPGYCCVDANKCVPIIGDREAGETCERTEENDDCIKGLFCLRAPTGSTGEGICDEFCVPNDPAECQPDEVCVPYNDGVLPLCVQPCNPLLQDCPPGWGCYAAFGGFACFVPGHEDGKGNDGDECYAVDSCVPGLACVMGDATAGCTADACCTPFCNHSGPASQCPEPTEECVPWFEEGVDPPGLEGVGVCLIPP